KIINLKDKSVMGMIIGKALYTGEIKLEEALKLARLK
ncbi:1-(5-phosphoribosyl)-5-((5-phosphoribosylamino)methylideneamino)imidazole-4-carboxamide isomerase, partial [Patescibacteria group bacterium]|nr:1-(5-phosphoribosyl)-5-((5-phosphoribosylamino)methylideneamino)imidazole-4-carboxamide isomerase [Patescibacteria group bacterium]